MVDFEKKAMLLHVAVGVIVGYLSYIISNNLYSLSMMLAVALAMKYLTGKLAKEKKAFNWWMGNGGAVYLFVWFITWIKLLNVLL